MSDCWIWPGPLDKDGYARAGGVWRLHRVVFQVVKRQLLEGEIVMHVCDNPPCFNPAHLEAGNQKQNIADRDSRGRRGDRQRGKPRLTTAQVLEVRSSTEPQRAIAARFKVDPSTISRIRTGDTWPEGGFHLGRS